MAIFLWTSFILFLTVLLGCNMNAEYRRVEKIKSIWNGSRVKDQRDKQKYGYLQLVTRCSSSNVLSDMYVEWVATVAQNRSCICHIHGQSMTVAWHDQLFKLGSNHRLVSSHPVVVIYKMSNWWCWLCCILVDSKTDLCPRLTIRVIIMS